MTRSQLSSASDPAARLGAPRALRAAYLMSGCALGLVATGFATAASVAPPGSFNSRVETYGSALAAALVGFLAAARVRLEWLRRFAPLFVAIVVALLLLVLVPQLGRDVKGARRWFSILGYGFQPSELAKIALIVFLADFISRDPERIARLRQGFLPAAGVVLLFAGLVFVEPDFGTSVYLITLGGVLLAIGGAPAPYLMASALLSIPAVVILAFRFLGHVGRRSTQDYQVVQGLRALAEGGLLGVGYGNGRMKYGQVPEGGNDFVLALIGEEWGLAGTLTVLLLFVGILVAGWKGARACRDPFARLVTFGVAFAIVFQAMFNIAVVTGVAPPKGIALPFVSAGGSALLGFSIAVGVAVNALRREAATSRAENTIVASFVQSSVPGQNREVVSLG
jgi:cell division protein FtsW